jgi:tetratricopeptide (TPR) repeat protein
VLVLVDEARPERLGDLVRRLLPEHPDLEVQINAVTLARARPGGLVILAPTPEQAPWLNQERPLLANRSLRVVLFCDVETSIALARRAPDFFHWISHRLACPPGPPAFAVRGIRSAMRARAVGVCWREGDFDAAFAAALPGRPLTRASAALPFEAMVAAARPAGRAWLAWTEVTGPFRLRRVRWAMAEAGRRGRSVLLEPGAEAPGFAPMHGRVLALAEAGPALAEAGARHPGRLAALLDLEPEGVDLAAGLLRAGVEEAALEAMLVGAEDPGVATSALGSSKGLTTPATLQTRIGARTPREADLIEALLRDEPREGERWLEGAQQAIAIGDAEVAVHLAKRAVALLGEDPRALTVAGWALAQQGSYADADMLFQRSLAIAERTGRTRERPYIEALRGRAQILKLLGKYHDAENALQRAITLETSRPGYDFPFHAILLADLGVVRGALGEYADASKLMRRSDSIMKRILGDADPGFSTTLDAFANVISGARSHEPAEAYLREALARATAKRDTDSPHMASILEGLGKSLSAQGQYAQAEPFQRRAQALQEATLGKHHHTRGASLQDLATSLLEQGKLAEAEDVALEALSIAETSLGQTSPAYAASLHTLACILSQRGEYEQAESMLQEALRLEEDILGFWHPELCPVLSNLAVTLGAQGLLEEAEGLAKRASTIASKKLGARHPGTATVLLHLASLQAQRESPDAKATARRAIKALTHAFGAADPRVRELEQLLNGPALARTP